MSASYDRAKSEAELAEYKSLTVAAPAVDSVRGILEAEGRAVSDHVTDCKEAVVCFD